MPSAKSVDFGLIKRHNCYFLTTNFDSVQVQCNLLQRYFHQQFVAVLMVLKAVKK